MEMNSSRPYLIRGIYEWIVDNHLTPYILVDVQCDGVSVPMEHVDNGRIVLNVSPSAVKNLNLGNEFITFVARFSGQAMEITLPCEAVLAIFAKENGHGMVFNDESAPAVTRPQNAKLTENKAKSDEVKEKSNKPHLTIVK